MPIRPLTLCCLLASAAGPACAAGLGGTMGAPPQLGQALDFVVQVRTDPAESLGPECVGAEVVVGERRLAPPLVRATLEPLGPESARVRVQTGQPIDEPVVTVNVSVGCAARVTRRYVLLVEPPATGTPAFAASPPDVQSLPAAPAVAPPGEAAAAVAPAPRPTAVLRTASTASTPSTANTASTTNTTNTTNTANTANTEREAPRAASAPRATPPRRARRPATTSAAAPPAATTPRPAAPAPRLRLELAEPPPRSAEAIAIEQAIEAVAQAASAARAAVAAASAAQARTEAQDRELAELRRQAQAQAELAVQLREQLAAQRGTSRWMLPLMVLVLALATLAMWLAWRLAAVQRRREVEWRQAVTPARAPAPDANAGAPPSEMSPSRQPTAPIPFITSELAPGRAGGAGGKARGAAPAWPPPSPLAQRTVWPESIPPPAEARAAAAEMGDLSSGLGSATRPAAPPTLLTDEATDESAPRDVSIEELIDLEQQAEFFVVLGQDEAAVDLLVEHLRQTGGGSPLPYLKLLEIYQRRGDHEAYERTRSRFNRRFNAYAPEWGADMASGRTLEDYVGVVPRLQQVWAKPLDAMAELEALLFRKSRGELFDLPAYREILFLYSIARDLLDREGSESGSVDLLLPMSDDTAYGATQAHPYLGLESDAMPLSRSPGSDERPTAPLDLDLTGKRPSLFGDFDDKPR